MFPSNTNVSSNLEGNNVGVVIATHKMFPKLEHCLRDFRRIVAKPRDLIFVDNGTDGEIGHWVERLFPETTIIGLQENRFFCGGYNEGIRAAMRDGYDFVLLVNADTEVFDLGFLNELLKTARRWPRAAFIGPMVYFRSPETIQKTCLRYPGILRNTAIWLPWRLARNQFQKQPEEETTVDFLNGICVLCRVKALREIGLMDEIFGGYVEDADWAWRASKKRWVSVFTPVPSVIHHEEVFGYNHYSMKSFLLKRNSVLWFLKTKRRKSAFIYALATISLEYVRMVVERSDVAKRKHNYFLKRLCRAYRGLLKGEKLGDWFGPPLGPWHDNA
jgi:GT2 family glycosyltransferase